MTMTMILILILNLNPSIYFPFPPASDDSSKQKLISYCTVLCSLTLAAAAETGSQSLLPIFSTCGP